MRDYKYGALGGLNREFIGLAVQTPELRAVVESFIANMRRVEGLGCQLPILVNLCEQHQRIGMETIYEIYNSIHVPTTGPTPEDLRIYQEKFETRLNDYLTKKVNNPMGSGAEWFSLGVKNMSFVANLFQMSSLMEALLSAIIVESWTAFESLVGDLWEAAINLHPDPLGRAAINNVPTRDDDESRSCLTAPRAVADSVGSWPR